MNADEKLEVMKEHHKIKAITLFQKAEADFRGYLKKALECKEINFKKYDWKKDKLATIIAAVITRKISSDFLKRIKSRRDELLYNTLINHIYRGK